MVLKILVGLSYILFVTLANAEEAGGNPNFGSFKISIGVDWPEYEKLLKYEEFYGSPGVRFNFGLDFYPLAKQHFALGFGLKTSMFSDSGKALKENPSGEYTEDSSGDLSLLATQFEFNLNILLSPLDSQFVALELWIGRGELLFKETRVLADSGAQVSDSESAGSLYLNKGSRPLISSGGSLLFDISGLNRKLVNSNKGTLGVDRIYLAPFFTNNIDQGEGGADFSNTSIGLIFGFEAAR